MYTCFLYEWVLFRYSYDVFRRGMCLLPIMVRSGVFYVSKHVSRFDIKLKHVPQVQQLNKQTYTNVMEIVSNVDFWIVIRRSDSPI